VPQFLLSGGDHKKAPAMAASFRWPC